MSEQKSLMQYRADSGAEVKLSPGIVKSYLTRGSTKISDQEVMMFMMLCRDQGLNPFLNEVYLIKYGNEPAQMTTSYDVFKQRAIRNRLYKGHNAGTIVEDKNGEIQRRKGCMVYSGDVVIGGWCQVERDGMATLDHEVSFEEYVGRKSNGEINRMWATKPGTMIRKVAVSQALREAFPESLQGLYTAEEYSKSEIDIPKAPMEMAPIPEAIEVQVIDYDDYDVAEELDEMQEDVEDAS